MTETAASRKEDWARFHLDIYFDEDDFSLTLFESDDFGLLKNWGMVLWEEILDPDNGYMATHAGWIAITDSEDSAVYRLV